MSPPMGKNAHIQIGGDLLIATVDGILSTSGAVTKSRAELELAAVTRNIKPMWRNEVLEKREWPWTMHKWDEFGGVFVTWPGGRPGKQLCAVVNAATGAWCRYTGWDATCFVQWPAECFSARKSVRSWRPIEPAPITACHTRVRWSAAGRCFNLPRRPSHGSRRAQFLRRDPVSLSFRS